MTWIFAPLAVLFASCSSVPAAADDGAAEKDVRPSVVKIEARLRQPNLWQPWLRHDVQEVSGSGLVIEGKKILTNAHVVSHAVQVTVQGQNSSEKFTAKVEVFAPGIDLAVLRLDEDRFFDAKPPLLIAESMPTVRDNVMVYGYPTGGTSLSVTKGIVSRVEFSAYDHETSGLRAQIDAAINPGNSGGPVVAGGKLLGVAFSRLGGADNIGYIIPGEEVSLFLDDVKDGKYDGKPAMFDALQTLENPALRKKLGLPAGLSGIVVHRAEPPGLGVESPLKEWDLITKIGDHVVDITGDVKVADSLNLPLQYYVQSLTKNGKVPLTVFRHGEILNLEVPVVPHRPRLLRSLRGGLPSYFIFGPLVFTPVTYDLAAGIQQTGRSDWLVNNASPVGLRYNDRPKFEDEEIVMIPCAMFAHRLVKGYSDPQWQTVREVNGVPIKNLRHLVEAIRDAKEDELVISFNEQHCESIVLDRKGLLAASEEILADNGIRKACSDDVRAMWDKK